MDSDFETLIVPALSALASSPDGTMTLSDFVAQLETRHGSTDNEAGDAQSLQSRAFEQTVRDMISDAVGSGSLVDRGFIETAEAGAVVTITEAGRHFIGRR